LKFARRRFLHLASGIAALPAMARLAGAQAWLSRPVRIVVGFPPGGVNDILARILAEHLSERLRQRFVVENRPGAGSNIATEAVARAAADGHTLLMIGPPQVINTTLYHNLTFNFIRDITAVAAVVRTPNVMEVTPSFSARTVPEFIAYAKRNPGRVNMASSGMGTSQHVAGELFKMMTGTSLLHVPYRGIAPALTDLIGGQVDVMFDPILSSIEHIRSGRLRALAVTSLTPMDVLPGIPTVSDFVPGFEASSAYGIGAPRNTPADIVNTLNEAINAILADPRTRAQLAGMGAKVLAGSPADFATVLAEETDKWGTVIRTSGAKAE